MERSKKRRTNCEIILAILRFVQEKRKANKTRIMQGTFLDGRAFQKYFNYLLEEGLVIKCNLDFEFYEITEVGKGVYYKLMEVDKIMNHSI